MFTGPLSRQALPDYAFSTLLCETRRNRNRTRNRKKILITITSTITIRKASDFRERTGLARRTAYDLLQELQKHRILIEHRHGRGSSPAIFVFKALVDITEAKDA